MTSGDENYKQVLERLERQARNRRWGMWAAAALVLALLGGGARCSEELRDWLIGDPPVVTPVGPAEAEEAEEAEEVEERGPATIPDSPLPTSPVYSPEEARQAIEWLAEQAEKNQVRETQPSDCFTPGPDGIAATTLPICPSNATEVPR